MDARCSLRVRGRDRIGGGGGGAGDFWGSLFHILSFLSFCLCRRRSRRVHPDAVPVEEEGFLGGSAQLYGDAVADDVSTLRFTGECSLSADTLSLGNCTLCSLGACSLRVGDAFCGSSYDLMEVTVSLDGISDGGAGSAVGGKLIFLYLLFNFSKLYLEFSSLKRPD